MSELARKVDPVSAEAVAPVRDLEQTVAQTVDRGTPDVHALLTPVDKTLNLHPDDLVRGILQRMPSDPIDLGRVENLLPLRVGPTAVETLLPPSPVLSVLEVGVSSLPASSPPHTLPPTANLGELGERISTRDSLATNYLAGPGGVEPWLDIRGAAESPAPGDDPSQLRTADFASHTLDSTSGGPKHPGPLDPASPMHPPEGPQVAASASGGSSFVPIAALLALLALAAPATLRRLGKVPDCRAPTPFVCALECPG